VILRDRACAWNGREVPAAYSHVHHMRWWECDDGPSDHHNAGLLCSHHHVVHQHDLTVTRIPRHHDGGDPPGETHVHRPEQDRWGGLLDEPTRYASRRQGDARPVNAPAPALPWHAREVA
jgi:hypothetical protein